MSTVPAGAVVGASPFCATPTTLLRALASRAESVPGLVLEAGPLLGDERGYLEQVQARRLRLRSWQLGAAARHSADAVEYVPMRARDVARYLRARVEVAIVRVSPPDAHGYCSFGPSASYTRSLLDASRLRIAEVDSELPRTLGADATYPYDALDHLVAADTGPCRVRSPESSPHLDAVASHVAELVPDGATLQLGIGAVPDALARVLSGTSQRGLRLLGLLSDASVTLVETGKVETSEGAIQVAELLGTEKVFGFAHDNPAVEMRASDTVHDPAWLARLPRLVSVCSALEVDLSGQVASEEVNGRPLSGVGGSCDFFEGAGLSSGGLRIVALPAAMASGASRIRAYLPANTPVTLARHSVDYVVTEYGIAHLAGRSIDERAEAMMAVVAPEHRAAVADEWLRRRTHKEAE